MARERSLERLLANLAPERRAGEYVFVSLPGEPPAGTTFVASVREPEGPRAGRRRR